MIYALVAGVRLELTTFGLWARRAANCSTPRYKIYKCNYTTNKEQCQHFDQKYNIFQAKIYLTFYLSISKQTLLSHILYSKKQKIFQNQKQKIKKQTKQ